ncbi:MAG: hypothetical protein HY059_13895 [Proteobacteria bacterium]|nr:hypothetical protein [Pseudomonadota bacterium]
MNASGATTAEEREAMDKAQREASKNFPSSGLGVELQDRIRTAEFDGRLGMVATTHHPDNEEQLLRRAMRNMNTLYPDQSPEDRVKLLSHLMNHVLELDGRDRTGLFQEAVNSRKLFAGHPRDAKQIEESLHALGDAMKVPKTARDGIIARHQVTRESLGVAAGRLLRAIGRTIRTPDCTRSSAPELESGCASAGRPR